MNFKTMFGTKESDSFTIERLSPCKKFVQFENGLVTTWNHMEKNGPSFEWTEDNVFTLPEGWRLLQPNRDGYSFFTDKEDTGTKAGNISWG